MTVTNYMWDAVNDTCLLETDANQNATAVYTSEPVQYGRVISQRRGTDTRYYHADALGSTRQVTDETGTVTDTLEYDAWGNERQRSGTTELPFRWVGAVGYYWDEDLQSYSIRRRTYQPAIGRWTSADPLEFVDGMDRYHYTNNIPTINTDASGTIVEVFAIEGAGARIGASDKMLEIYYKPIAMRYRSKVRWRYYYQKVIPPGGGGIAKHIAQLAMTPEEGCPCAYRRIIVIGYSWGGNTAWDVLLFLSNRVKNLKIDAVLTIDPVFKKIGRSETMEAVRNIACSWTNFFQNTDENSARIPKTRFVFPIRGDRIEGTVNYEIKDLGRNRAHVRIARDSRVRHTFDSILNDYIRGSGSRRRDWKGQCPIRACLECGDCK